MGKLQGIKVSAIQQSARGRSERQLAPLGVEVDHVFRRRLAEIQQHTGGHYSDGSVKGTRRDCECLKGIMRSRN